MEKKCPLRTTVIGSYPKPAYLKIPDWFRKGTNHLTEVSKEYNAIVKDGNHLEDLKRAIQQCLTEQAELGIDVVTDGELGRENYVFDFCRNLTNFDFEKLTFKVYRNGAVQNHVPTVRGPLAPRSQNSWCVNQWRLAQSMSDRPVKFTIPGPMTIANTTADDFYNNPKELSESLIKCINREVRALSDAGCKYIQVDEPLLVRIPEVAMDYGIDHLRRCFEGVDSDVTKTIHLCCGYPTHLDAENYLKAERKVYFDLAEKLDNAGFDEISIEDAWRYNDLSLLDKFKKSTIVFGVLCIARSQVETVDEIEKRIKDALSHITRERLVIAPDCGLGFLPKDILLSKLKNMVEAATKC